jgi:hypothetical protein
VKPRLLTALALSLMTAFATAAEPDLRHRHSQYGHQRASTGRLLHLPQRQLDQDHRDPGRQIQLGHLRQAARRHLSQLRGLIEKSAAEKAKTGTEAQKVADLYASFMDEDKLNQLGIRPLTGELNRIRALKDKKACRC